MFFFFEIFVSRRRRDWLVSWVKKASLERIQRLLDITEGEHNHELLLSVKNLRELGASPFPYIVPVIPCLLPVVLVRGEHFTLAELLKSIPGSSAQVRSAQETQAEIAERALGSFVQPDQSPLAEQDSQPASQAANKKRKKAKKVGQIKADDARLDSFVDWVDPILSEQAEEREEDMSSLTAGFSTRMRKRAASA